MKHRKQGGGNGRKKAASIVLAAALALQVPLAGLSFSPRVAWGSESSASLPAAAAQESARTAAQSTLRLLSEQPVTSGAVLRTYEFTTERNKERVATRVNVIAVDLHNPYVRLDVMTGVGGRLEARQTVVGMARETGAVAGINGDLFHMQLTLPPIGPVIDNGVLLASPNSPEGWYMFGLSKNNQPVIDFYTFEGQIVAPNGATFPLAGINRAATWSKGVHSHVDKVFMYTPEWGSLDRGNDGNTYPYEVLVQNGVIAQMVSGKTLGAAVPENSYIFRANGKAAEFFRNNFKIGDPIVYQYDLKPRNANNPVRGQDLHMLIGGHTLLVDQGKPAAFTADISGVSGSQHRARTGIGYSQDGRYVYLITADYAGDSKGFSLKEFQDFMVLAGVWKGMNLDGGGSTTMAARPLGDREAVLVNQPQEGTQRRVVNGIGVYTTAPQGELLGFFITGPQLVFLNEKAVFQAKGYDTFYNPFSEAGSLIQWSLDHPLGTIDNGVFIPTKPGTASIVGKYKDFVQRYEVKVAGRDDIASLRIDAGNIVFSEGKSYRLPVLATLTNGQKKTLSNESVEWEFIGFTGTFEGDMLTVGDIEASDVCQIIARYDGFSTILTVPVEWETLWADFDQIAPEVQFIGYPSEVKGWADIVNGLYGVEEDNDGLFIAYDFFGGAENVTKAAYASFNGDQGLEVPGEPQYMKLKVYGDMGKNWVRAEFVDRNGKSHLVDISRNVDWRGYKEFTVDLSSYQMEYPVKLKRLYVTRPKDSGDERERGGGVAFDDISFLYRGRMPESERPAISLTINQNRMTVNGEIRDIDMAPEIRNKTTFVPVRFIIEALQGQVDWNDKERQVTVRKGPHLIELWVDRNELVIDGTRVKALAAPFIKNKRTMVPVRIISETFGWEVSWDEATKTVTLQ